MWTKVKRYFRFLLTPVPNPDKWLFLAGCPNSGTTLLHEILAKHPDIGSMPKEGQFCTDQWISPYSIGVSRIWVEKLDFFYLDDVSRTSINLKRLQKQWALHYNDTDRPVLMEKSPTNSVRSRWLQKHFNNAYFIGIYRNGYVVSKGIEDKVKCTIEVSAKQWLKSNEIMLEDWNKLENKLLIRYEDLTEHPQEIMNKITTFLGIEALSEHCIQQEYFIQGKQRSIENLNAPVLSRLTSDEVSKINSIAEQLLSKLNYPVLRAEVK